MSSGISPQFYRTLFDNAPIGLALCRMTGELVHVNKAYAEILGRTVEETLRLSYWQITPRRYERQEAEQLEAMQRDGRYGPYEKEYLHRESRLVPVRLSGVVVEIEGEKYIWSQVEDLTEERYRTLFHSAQPPLALCEVDGTVLSVNKAFATMLGSTVDKLAGLNFWRMTPRQKDEQDRERQQDLARDGRFYDYGTYFCDRGHCFPVMVQGLRVPIRGKNYDLFCVEPGEMAGEIVGDAESFEWESQSQDDLDRWRPIRQ